jgi:molecular chaperone GrpE
LALYQGAESGVLLDTKLFWSKIVVNNGQQETDTNVSDENVNQEPAPQAATAESDSQATADTGDSGSEAQNDTVRATEAAAEVADDIVGAEVTLEHLQQELEAAREASLRAQAEAQNARRRADQEVEKARKYALDRFAGELLPVVDNLERALEATAGGSEEVKPIADGVELTLKSFLDAMRKFNIEQIDPAGEPFDPQLHQAMSMVENPDVEPNSVLQVMQKGYSLNGRLIRPAMVLVSKAP